MNDSRRPVAIVGFGQTPIEAHAGRPLGALALMAVRAAVADAGLEIEDIDGVVTVNGLPSLGTHAQADGVTSVSADWLVRGLGGNPEFALNVQGAPQLAGAVAVAADSIASGRAGTVVVYRALHNPTGHYQENTADEFGAAQQWTAPQGYFGPIAAIALPGMEYVQRFGVEREALAEVAVTARRNGARVPWSSWYGNPLSIEEYLAAPRICDPIGRYDCDRPVDGAAAFVLTSAARARDRPNRPVYLTASVLATSTRHRALLHWPLEDIQAGGADLARRLWRRSGLRPEDVDLPQVYDGFSPFVYFWLEALGYCGVGEAHRFVSSGGIDADTAGGIPVLSGGGSLGNGRMHGVAQLLECYLQLAGRAGDRQRHQARTAVATYGPPQSGGAFAFSIDPT